MRRKGFVLYGDYLEPIQRLDDAEAGKLFKAILQYAVDGTKADFPGTLGMAYAFITSQMQANR